jgi:CheY-like chemotaxis protein
MMPSTAQPRQPITILMADDDAEDRMLARDALTAGRVLNDFHAVCDGEELMNYLNRRGSYAAPGRAPRPGLILLDLAMPRKSGRAALAEIKADPRLRQIPVVVMTTSSEEEDVCRSYDLGAASYVTKPISFEALVEVMRAMGRYWLEVVELPEA